MFASPRLDVNPSEMTEILILIVLAAIVKLMLVTVFAGMRYRRRRDLAAPPVSTDTSTVIGSW
jgi:hypothetical protein